MLNVKAQIQVSTHCTSLDPTKLMPSGNKTTRKGGSQETLLGPIGYLGLNIREFTDRSLLELRRRDQTFAISIQSQGLGLCAYVVTSE